MEGEKLIATLLVHLRTKEEYEKEAQNFWEKSWNRTRASFETVEDFEARREEYLGEWRWPPWRFNDIVGYVEVVFDGGTRLMAIGHLPKKRISRQLIRKSFYHYGIPGYGKILDVHMMLPLTESKVRDALSTTLEDTHQWFADQGLNLECDPRWFDCLDLKKLLSLHE